MVIEGLAATVGIWLAEKLGAAVISVGVKEMASKKFREWLSEKGQEKALHQAITQAFERFETKHPDLSASFFDEAFLTGPAFQEISKTLNPSSKQDPKALAEIFAKQFPGTSPDVEAAATDFLQFLTEAMQRIPAFHELCHQRQASEHLDISREVLQKTNSIFDMLAGLPNSDSPHPAKPHLNSDVVVKVFGAASQELLNWPQLTEGQWIERPEIDILRHLLAEAEEGRVTRTSVLLGPPGCGKSALLAHLGEELRQEGFALLAIKADMLPKNLHGLGDLQSLWGAPGDIASCLEALAETTPTVLLIDQLDALSELMDLHSDRLSVLLSLIHQAQSIKKLHIILSCRDFEFQHDVRLSSLKTKEVRLNDPEWDKVLSILQSRQIVIANWSSEFQKMLRRPQHLALFLRHLSDDPKAPMLGGYQAMLEEVIQQRILNNANGGRAIEAAAFISSKMADEEELWLGTARFEAQFGKEIDLLVEADILTKENGGKRIGFRHQTVFDFFRARSFVHQEGGIASFVLERQDALFVRSTLWSALHYLRDADPGVYYREFDKLWCAPTLRRHVRILMAEFLGKQTRPDRHEIDWLLQILDKPKPRKAAFWAMHGNDGWFNILKPHLPSLMTESEQSGFEAAWVLRAAISSHRNEVLDLVERLWTDAKWADLVVRLFNDMTVWDDRSFNMIEGAVGKIEPFWIREMAKNAIETRSDLAARLIAKKFQSELANVKATLEPVLPFDRDQGNDVAAYYTWQEKAYGPVAKLLADNQDWYDLEKLAYRMPAEYFKETWPWYKEIFALLATDSPAGQYRRLHGLSFEWDKDEAQPHYHKSLAIIYAAEGWAERDPEIFLQFVLREQSSDISVIHRLIVNGLCRIVATHPTATLDYLLGDKRRMAIGDMFDAHKFTRQLIAAIAQHLNQEQLSRLETAIIHFQYSSDREEDNASLRFERMKWNRQSRLRLLRAIPLEFRTHCCSRLVSEELRALGEVSDHDFHISRAHRSLGIMSQGEMQRASDDEIINFFEEFPDSLDWDHPDRFDRGSSIETSRAFADFAKDNPDKAFAIMDRFQPGSHERPVGYALEAMAKDEKLSARLVTEIHRLHDRGFTSIDFRYGAASALEKIAGQANGLDDDTCKLLEGWLHDEKDRTTAQPKRGNGEHKHSILWGMSGLIILPQGNYTILKAIELGYLCRTSPEADAWLAVLEGHLDRQESISVWQNLARDFRFLFHADRERTNSFFRRLLTEKPDVLPSRDGVRFLAWTHSWLPDDFVHQVVATWLSSTWIEGRQAAGEVLMLRHAMVPDDSWALETINRNLECPDCNDSRADFMFGLASSAANLWEDSRFRSVSAAMIERLIPIADGDTRGAILDLFRTNKALPPDEHTTRLLELLIAYPDMLKGRSTFLIDHLKDGLDHTLAPPLVAYVIEKFIQLNFSDLGDIRTSLAGDVDDLIDIVLTLQRTPEFRSRSTDLFELLLENGAYGIDKTLKEIDKRL